MSACSSTARTVGFAIASAPSRRAKILSLLPASKVRNARQVERGPPDAVKHKQGANGHQPDTGGWIAIVGKEGTEEESARQENRGPDQRERSGRAQFETLHAPNCQADSDVDQCEHRPVEMPKRKHEPPHFISDIQIPRNLKAVHRLQHDPKADVNRERPPTKAKMSGRIIHWYDLAAGRRRISTDCADCTDRFDGTEAVV